MTDKEGLQAFARGERLDQPTIKRLMRAGLIEARNVTTLDTQAGEEDFLPMSITRRGQKILES